MQSGTPERPDGTIFENKNTPRIPYLITAIDGLYIGDRRSVDFIPEDLEKAL